MILTSDLTKGNIRKQLIALSVPLIIGNIFQQFYNTTDCYIVGQCVNQYAFAALGIAGSLMNLFIFMINGCCNGISIVFSQLYGQRNWIELKKETFLSLIIGIAFSEILSICAFLFLDVLLIFIQTPLEMMSYVKDYLYIIMSFLVIVFIYNWCSAILRAIGDSKTALYILIISMFLNIILDIFFVKNLCYGVKGAAIATIISQFFSAILCFLYIRKVYPQLLFSKNEMVFDKQLIKKTMSYGFVSALHQSSLYIGKLIIQGTVNRCGLDVITSYTLTMRIEGFINSFGDSGCVAISILVGQNIGAGKSERVKNTFIIGLKMMIILCICLSIIMIIGTKPVTYLFIDGPSIQIINNTFYYILIISFFYIFCFIGNCFVGFYRGIGKVNIPVIGTILHISLRVIISILLIEYLQLPAVALATGIGWMCVVLYQYIYFNLKIKKTDKCNNNFFHIFRKI